MWNDNNLCQRRESNLAQKYITFCIELILHRAQDKHCEISEASSERQLNRFKYNTLLETFASHCIWIMTILNKVLLVFVLLHGIQFSVRGYRPRPLTSTRIKSQRSSESATMKYRMRFLSLANTPETSATNWISKNLFRLENLPLIGITVGIIAFSFQLSVLYPWHIELHKDFTALEVKRRILFRYKWCCI